MSFQGRFPALRRILLDVLLGCRHEGLTRCPGIAGFGGGIWLFTLFKGYDWLTVLVVANLAFSGLLVSWVMKFADSILKVSARATDVMLSAETSGATCLASDWGKLSMCRPCQVSAPSFTCTAVP